MTVVFGLGVILLFVLGTNGALAGAVMISSGNGIYSIHQISSYKEALFKEVIRQRYDFSCGSAAVATLLTHHYGDPVTEHQVFREMYEHGDQNKIQEQGFSLLDMKMYLQNRNYRADGFRVSLDKLSRNVGIPAIALINLQGYKHFVVVKAVDSQRVLVGDPAKGRRIIARPEFEAMWNGILFVIRDNTDIARQTFDANSAWQIRPKGPLGMAISRAGLAAFTTSLPLRGDF